MRPFAPGIRNSSLSPPPNNARFPKYIIFSQPPRGRYEPSSLYFNPLVLEMKPTIVRTPKRLPLADQDKRTLKEVGQLITKETRTEKKWTDLCTNTLEKNPKCLFLYDRFEYSLKKAFGANIFIALNPSMILCYHPECRNNCDGPHKLRNVFKLKEYLEHLENHTDVIGIAMQLRFALIDENPFATKDQLDALASAPVSLIGNLDLQSCNSVSYIEQYGIKRILQQYDDDILDPQNYFNNTIVPNNPNYICHWKDLLISSDIIDSSSLQFQEDDAFITNVLYFPSPVPNWSIWGTLFLFSMKLMTAISSTALNLFRGVTFNMVTTKAESLPDIKEFARNINHACPSVVTTKKMMPNLRYDNETYHPSEILFHIKTLERSEDSFRFDFSSNVTIFPVTAGIDEQETNQGTFVVNGELCGLKMKMTAADVRKVGLENMKTYIVKENPFVIAVREYRLTDFAGIFCSNSLTSFETHALNATECTEDLNDMIAFASRCEACLKLGLECTRDRIDQPCESCASSGACCKSLAVFHVTWDMGSGHKKTSEESSFCLDVNSDTELMMSPKYYTIGFGGLHICKALVNILRNYNIQHNGEYFGTDVLIALREISASLQLLKNAVFVGKDRQSDLLSYLTVCGIVQEALSIQKQYCIQRVPEKYMSYKKNASSQKKIIYAVDLCTNSNGEIFILDAGAACVHIVDRSTVAAIYLIGKYNAPNIQPYPKNGKNTVNGIRLSNSLMDISIDRNSNVYVTDSGRKELIIIRSCVRAKRSTKTTFHAIKVKKILSSTLSTHDDNLYVLRRKKSGQVVQLLSFDLTKKSKSRLSLGYNVVLKMRPSMEIEKLFALPFDRCFGGMDSDNNLKLFYYSAQSKGRISEHQLEPTSITKPFVHLDGTMLASTGNGLILYQLSFDGKSVSTDNKGAHEFSGSTIACCVNGKVISAAVVNQNSFCLLQLGPLDFAVKYSKAISALYDAIGYVPPRGDRAERLEKRQISFQESILKGRSCAQLFTEMQREAEERNPGRSSFRGADGMPYSDTIHCLESTVDSWEIVQKRVEQIEQGSSSRIHPPSIGSEKNVEHSFGYVMKKGQGHNQNMQEYIIAKRMHGVDFQIRMCEMPFCQYTKEKLQDKGYQQIEGDRCKINIKELREIFAFSQEEGCSESDVTDEDEHLLKKAYLLSKSVPRQSNRAKWRERSGFQPNMLIDKSSPGMLIKNDLVCCRTVRDTLMFLIVEKDVLLDQVDVKISVRFPEGTISFMVSIDKLVTENGQIMAIPMQLYDVVDGEVQLCDAVSIDFEVLLHNQGQILSDEEWAVLVLPPEESPAIITSKTRKRTRDSHNSVGISRGKQKKTEEGAKCKPMEDE